MTATVPTQKESEGASATRFVIVYRDRFPIQQRRVDGTWGCRGCGEIIPKGRQTWCSAACSKKYHPTEVRWAVKRRDKDICCQCGFDCAKARRDWENERWHTKLPPDFNYSDWLSRKPPPAEYDHIIPFSEGGLTVLENMRTLCWPCHKKRTKLWHGERKIKATPELALTSVGRGNDNHLAPLSQTSDSVSVEQDKKDLGEPGDVR